MKDKIILFVLFLMTNTFLTAIGSQSNCWLEPSSDNPLPSTYDEWIKAGDIAQVSKQKICCYSKALSKAGTKTEKAIARNKRGYSYMFYVIDSMGITWEEGDKEEGQMISSEGDESIREELSVPKSERWADALADFNAVLSFAENSSEEMPIQHADAYFGKGFINYSKGRIEGGKEDGENEQEYYQKALEYFNQCIARDRWCSSAYQMRSFIYRRKNLANETQENKDKMEQNKTLHTYCQSYDDASEDTSTGLTAYYFYNVYLQGSDNSDTRIDLGSLYHKVENTRPNNTWSGSTLPGAGSHDLSVFGVVWKGRIKIPKTGSYTFYLNSDDGSRLFLDNSLSPVINNWHDHSSKEVASEAISYEKDQWINVHVEFYENGGGERCELRWEGPGISKSLINYKYLYPPPTPDFAMQPSFWQHSFGDLNGWHLEVFGGNTDNLTAGFNEQMTALWLPKYHHCQLYQHVNFTGKNFSFNPGKHTLTNAKYNFTSGDSTVSFNDRATSYKVTLTDGFGTN